MYMTEYDVTQYHEERVRELSRHYEGAVLQEQQIRRQLQAFGQRIGEWFGSSGGAGQSRQMEPQPVRVENRS